MKTFLFLGDRKLCEIDGDISVGSILYYQRYDVKDGLVEDMKLRVDSRHYLIKDAYGLTKTVLLANCVDISIQ